MLPVITVFGRTIAMYGLMIVLGMIFGISAAVIRSKKHGFLPEDVLFASFFGGIGLFIGAKVLYLILILPKLIRLWSRLIQEPEQLKFLLTGGFVFYGGLVGAAVGYYIYCRKYRLSYPRMLDLVTPVIPLIHAFGRLGCFFAGCCYGIPYNGPGHLSFHRSFFAPTDIPLFPTQILEAAINFSAFVFLVLYARTERKPGNITGIYILYYSVMRFFLEFVRGDIVRGNYLGISTSQWISLAFIPLGIFLISGYKTVNKN